MESIGERIKLKRKLVSLTQLELANQLNVTDRAVSKWEQGNGNPDIILIPKIAKLLNVTTDYLLSGNEPEDKIIFMSKIELCAKNDDPSILMNFNSYSASIKDETGHSLMDYVKQYDSNNVLKALIDSCERESDYKNLFNFKDYIYEEELIELLTKLVPLNLERKVLQGLGSKELIFFDNFYTQNDRYFKRRTLNHKIDVEECFNKIFRYLVANYSTLPIEQKEYYFELDGDGGLERTKCWSYAYSNFIEIAYDCDKVLFEKFINRIDKSNSFIQKEIENITHKYKFSQYKDHYITELTKKYANKIYVSNVVFDKIISVLNFEYASKINKYIFRPFSEREIKLKMIEISPESTETDLLKFKYVIDGILNIDALLSDFKFNENDDDLLGKLKDAKLNLKLIYEHIINNNPIHHSEAILALLDRKDLKDVYEYSFDHGFTFIANKLLYKQTDNFEQDIIDFFTTKDNKSIYSSLNLIEFRKLKKEKLDNWLKKIEDKIEEITQSNHIANEYNKIKSEVTADFISSLIQIGDFEKIAVKLCVRLETIFKYKYGFQGDLNDMISQLKLHKKTIQKDDGWGYMQDYKVDKYDKSVFDTLYKIRTYRNSVVHSNTKSEQINEIDVKSCISIINELDN